MKKSILAKARKNIDKIADGEKFVSPVNSKKTSGYKEALFAVRYICHKAIEEYICEEYPNCRVVKEANCRERLGESREEAAITPNAAKIIVAVKSDEEAERLKQEISEMVDYANSAIDRIAYDCHKKKYAIKYKINYVEADGPMDVAIGEASSRQIVSGENIREHIGEYYRELAERTEDESLKEQYEREMNADLDKIADDQLYSKHIATGCSYRLSYYDIKEKRRKQTSCNQILIVKNQYSIDNNRLSKTRLDKYDSAEIIEVAGEKYYLTHSNYANRKKKQCL